jgi:hypothetical protein
MLPLVNKKTDVLGIVDSDIYSLRLFRYNPDTKLMEVAWEKCHEKINGHCKTFRLHWGYAGIAVEYSEVVVIPRTDQRDIHTNFFDGTQEEIALQKAHYKSIILVPVPVGNSESNNGVPSAPVVLAITSNKYDHFTEEHEMIANIYRSVLAAYFSKFPSQLGIAQ